MENLSEYATPYSFVKRSASKGLIAHISWEWNYLRKKCRDLRIENFYQEYIRRIRLSFLRLFIFIAIVLKIVNCAALPIVSHIPTVDLLTRLVLELTVFSIVPILALCLLCLCFRKSLVNNYPKIYTLTSWVALLALVLNDIMFPLHQLLVFKNSLMTLYHTFLICSAYIFMPLPTNQSAICLGLICSFLYISFFYYVFQQDHTKHDTTDIASECSYFFGVNLFGVFFRYAGELYVRKQVIVLYQLIEQNMTLRKIKNDEQNLIWSIIPPNIAKQIEADVYRRIEALKNISSIESTNDFTRQNVYRGWYKPDSLYIDFHPEVTILYADIVQFTNMTTKMDVQTLVETLHDLFVKFDIASEKLRVLRVKFLGDCYYSVAGIPYPYEAHAINCVQLGLYMIEEIRRVSREREIEIDMRIGVHSGSVWSGVIGANKWQFDIWSIDVEVANQLQTTGLGSHIHISDRTLKLLYGEFYYEEGTEKAKNDPLLQSCGITTYMISGVRHPSEFFMKESIHSIPSIINTSITSDPVVDLMYTDLEKLPMGSEQFDFLRNIWNFICCKNNKTDRRFSYDEYSNLHKWTLLFKKPSWEREYSEDVDYMLKYSALFSFFLFCCILVQLSHDHEQSHKYWVINGFALGIVAVVTFLIWYKRLWMISVNRNNFAVLPKSGISLFFYKISMITQRAIKIRLILFIFLIGFQLFSVIYEMDSCDKLIKDKIQELKQIKHCYMCFKPDSITESVTLIICSSFLFTRVAHIVKLPIVSCIIIIYIYVVTVLYKGDFEKGLRIGLGFSSIFAHIYSVVIMFYVFVTIDRQMEIINKMDFTWKRQLKIKHMDSKAGKETISILLRNILPQHVAEIYTKKLHRDELYYEDFRHVAVMFASIKNVEYDSIHLLNEIICHFDEVLFQYQELVVVEKIKVSGKTYMAACGLELKLSLRSSRSMHNFRRTSSSTPVTSSAVSFLGRSISADNFKSHKPSRSTPISQQGQVRILASFATDLMRTLRKLNNFYKANTNTDSEIPNDISLQIGMAYGPVMAGVVGFSRPHYDIWGNVVNLAARLDQTGIENKIHVDEVTANVLKSYNIRCAYRGMTAMKGFDAKPTYFIDLDDDYDFINIDSGKKRGSVPSIMNLNSIQPLDMHSISRLRSTYRSTDIRHIPPVSENYELKLQDTDKPKISTDILNKLNVVSEENSEKILENISTDVIETQKSDLSLDASQATNDSKTKGSSISSTSVYYSFSEESKFTIENQKTMESSDPSFKTVDTTLDVNSDENEENNDKEKPKSNR